MACPGLGFLLTTDVGLEMPVLALIMELVECFGRAKLEDELGDANDDNDDEAAFLSGDAALMLVIGLIKHKIPRHTSHKPYAGAPVCPLLNPTTMRGSLTGAIIAN